MVAEWCFCVLVDFAAHKPATLRDDGPAVLEHFAAGDGAQRRGALLRGARAPRAGPLPETGGSLRPPADVFAAGCVAAEILNGGAPTLDAAAALAPRAPVDRAGRRRRPSSRCGRRRRGRPSRRCSRATRTARRRGGPRGGRRGRRRGRVRRAGGRVPAAARLGRAALARPTPDARVAPACRAYGGLARALGGASDADGAAALAAAGAALDGDGATEAPLARPGAAGGGGGRRP